MIRLKTCNICKKKFKANRFGRIQIVKRLERGKIEIWICPECVPEIKEKLRDLNLKLWCNCFFFVMAKNHKTVSDHKMFDYLEWNCFISVTYSFKNFTIKYDYETICVFVSAGFFDLFHVYVSKCWVTTDILWNRGHHKRRPQCKQYDNP